MVGWVREPKKKKKLKTGKKEAEGMTLRRYKRMDPLLLTSCVTLGKLLFCASVSLL